MMSKTFGQFEPISDSQSTQANKPVGLPPIAGTPMPNAGMRDKTMGSVFPSKDNPSPKQFQNRKDAAKRMSQMPKQSPLGPVTGMPRPQQPATASQPPQQGSPNMDTGTGDRWMGELWQGLTMDNQPQGGFAMGGQVGSSNPAMDLYNQVTMELESGGVNSYAQGGMVDKSREIASMGRNGDTMLMHINPQELGGLQSLLGPITVNPDTGNPEAFSFLLPLVLGGMGAGISAQTGGDTKQIVGGALTGVMAGLSLGSLAASAGTGTASAGTAGAGTGTGTGTAGAASAASAGGGLSGLMPSGSAPAFAPPVGLYPPGTIAPPSGVPNFATSGASEIAKASGMPLSKKIEIGTDLAKDISGLMSNEESRPIEPNIARQNSTLRSSGYITDRQAELQALKNKKRMQDSPRSGMISNVIGNI